MRVKISIMTCVVLCQTVNLALGRSGSSCCRAAVTWLEMRLEMADAWDVVERECLRVILMIEEGNEDR